MSAKPEKTGLSTKLLQDILIVHLGTIGVTQQDIRKIVGVDLNRVNRIVKYIKKAKRAASI